MADFLPQIEAYWLWLLLGVALLAAELATFSTFLIGPGVAAIVVGLISAVFPGLPLTLAIVIFSVITGATTFVARRMAKDLLKDDAANTLNSPRARLLGRIGTVQSTDAANFVVNLDGVNWRARCDQSPPLAPGERVRVEEVEGALLVVERAPV